MRRKKVAPRKKKCKECGGPHTDHEAAVVTVVDSFEDVIDQSIDNGLNHGDILFALGLVISNWASQQESPRKAMDGFKDSLDEELHALLEKSNTPRPKCPKCGGEHASHEELVDAHTSLANLVNGWRKRNFTTAEALDVLVTHLATFSHTQKDPSDSISRIQKRLGNRFEVVSKKLAIQRDNLH
jgi:transcription elongation factor Elf1